MTRTQFVFAISLAFVLTPLACGIEPAKSPICFVQPQPIVGVPTGADQAHKALARQLADALGQLEPVELATNPVCCIWVEINRFTPNAGKGGYVIVNDAGGSIITASDLDQLRAAVRRFKKSIRKRDGKPEIPGGLLTNYPIVATE